ncbi:metal-dependent phosphohydrolase [Pontibacter sp. 172403-2]|uniref:Pycsar system effector family protein n=1 Tax=Pontibacter rufus TaxID=2791028 RepID=UPI0018AFE1A4|nr:Pycsar system effector family protein [Pontibacter sp. 172403-2]MBF9251704.1 metal-dependent phosphohydrolase [Pontibacter sp. 172403-2]
MQEPTIIEEAGEYVLQLFKKRLSKKMVYHNYRHTLETVTEAQALGELSELPQDELQDLVLAAWFHDTGYINTYKGHEEESKRLATEWLQAHGYPQERIARINSCIEATQSDVKPQGLLQELLADADMSNIGKSIFTATAELLRVEWEIFLDLFFTDREWAKFQMDFLLSTSFSSVQAQQKFAAQLGLNIQEQRKRLSKEENKKKKRDKSRRKTLAQPKRGIETMFRNTYKTHLDLSSIADNKANMMISLNAIILSVIITYLSAKTSTQGTDFAQHRSIIIPVGTLLLTALGSVVFAIISAQPEVTSLSFKRKNKDKINSRNVNLLFFGNFTKLPLEDFQKGMHEIMRDKKSLYNNMITDIYYLGEVLNRKYRVLRISYAIFMVGLVLTVIAFGIAIAFY